ncbi:uncharacterized protein LOC116418290 [Nasonia vitripennis]|uniref:Uncharacterized protein n=1 Tax=Nasonia vitripennis TaxID=7425 RepID=A0A7M7QQ62_NASVI|nr:uncharacterized protein LOC116418290 [Nasonia vitripennis]
MNNYKQSSTIRDLMGEEAFFESILVNVDWSPAELMLMTLKYYLSTRSSITSLSNLLKLINRICGQQFLPETRYRINQLYKDISNVTLHSVCPECSQYLEPTDAVRDYLETHHEYYDYVVKERIHETDHIKDVYDGKLYRKFVKSLSKSDRNSYATMAFNTDGAPVFESSNFSIWPIYGMLNEIPVQDRLNSTITISLCFGLNKPKMGIFLHEFVEVFNDLSTVEINCKIKDEERSIKIFPLIACVDTIARAPMNGSMQFNARCGCDWFLHPAIYHSGSMRYPFLNPPAEDRNRNNTIDFVKQAIETGKPVNGMRNVPCSLLKRF